MFGTPLRCLKETAKSCEFYDNVFETNRKWLVRALFFPVDQLASSPKRCQGSSCLTTICVVEIPGQDQH